VIGTKYLGLLLSEPGLYSSEDNRKRDEQKHKNYNWLQTRPSVKTLLIIY